ncbi:MAG: hypothetical protein Q9222_003521 [Ikaeria aurantiellina]
MHSPSIDLLHPPSPKRRRVNGTQSHSPSRYSSPDELAASSDHEPQTTTAYHRRTSSNTHIQRRTSAEHSRRRSYEGSNPEEEDSPDELDHTIHTFYRNDNYNRNNSHIRPDASLSRHATPDAPSVYSVLTPLRAPASPATPLPLPPPKQARYLPYRQKLVLRGHKKGVASVRFSPKGDMLASCCE